MIAKLLSGIYRARVLAPLWSMVSILDNHYVSSQLAHTGSKPQVTAPRISSHPHSQLCGGEIPALTLGQHEALRHAVQTHKDSFSIL